MIKNKSILITGAAGFIGSHLTEELLKNNNYLTLIDNFSDYYLGKEQQINEVLKDYTPSKDYNLIRGDLLDNSLLNKINDDIEFVFHLAAQAGVRYSLQHEAEVMNNNIISTVNIFKYSLAKNVKKTIFASSSSVYGNPLYTPVDEDHPKNPISPYAVSKLCCEIYASYYYREYNLPITSLRFYTVYGPRGRPDMAIRKFFNLMLRDKEITIYGDGEQIRDFTYVSDIVRGLLLSAEINGSNGKILNLGCSNPVTVNDLVDKMYQISNKEKKINYIEKKTGDVDITHANTEMAKKLLNFNVKIKIDEGLLNQYNWQKNIQRS